MNDNEDDPELERVKDWMATGAAKCVRIAANVSTVEIARMVGCSQSAVVRWERSGQPGGRGANGEPKLLLRYGLVLKVLAARVRDEFVHWMPANENANGRIG